MTPETKYELGCFITHLEDDIAIFVQLITKDAKDGDHCKKIVYHLAEVSVKLQDIYDYVEGEEND